MRDPTRDTDVKNRLLDSMGEGKGGYVKQITSPGLMHETGCSVLVHWDDPERLVEEGSGREVQDREHMYTHG